MKKEIFRIIIAIVVSAGVTLLWQKYHTKETTITETESPPTRLTTTYKNSIEDMIVSYTELCRHNPELRCKLYDTLVQDIIKHMQIGKMDTRVGDLAFAYELRMFVWDSPYADTIMSYATKISEETISHYEWTEQHFELNGVLINENSLLHYATRMRSEIAYFRAAMLKCNEYMYVKKVHEWDDQLMAYENRLHSIMKRLGPVVELK